LAAQDTNHDHRITAADAHFQSLKVWVDANHDGRTDAGELKSLAQLGIVELDLSPLDSTREDHGNFIGQIASYKTADGKSHEMADVWLAKTPLSELLVAPPDGSLPGAALQAAAAATPTVAPLAHAQYLHPGLDDPAHHILI
jgi:hypothetical protein